MPWWRRGLRSTLNGIAQQLEKIMAKIEDLQDAVAKQRSVEQSVVTLIQGLAQQITDLKNQGGASPQQLDQLLSDINSNTQALADAVTANTPQAAPADTQPAQPPQS